ncbi:hypothetical protein [Flagellimonas zhangzhouensis]|uniref:Uncharacterized protein n=1 Tax=Flagellimonas zhangzhouensis TaxID=1073328 RepID=A0A1H2WUE1_9FLAO|nr:hypothetical protein [Allomuricauda zhangzhouensis]SDQ24843.1 hypothetical protein SAMN05216294_1060 [Allomuricauda zhangzhouensis]SDW84126.1 hypothetical protein SAMN04487892_2440 [Allomuricauda zhangzhouensis]
MLSNFNNSLELLETVQKEQLYQKLLQQLQKDFELANVSVEIPSDISPTELKSLLHEKIYLLIVEKFPEYLNLLYVVDISEQAVKNIPPSDVVDISAEVCFLLLKREWQKVWYKAKYSS